MRRVLAHIGLAQPDESDSDNTYVLQPVTVPPAPRNPIYNKDITNSSRREDQRGHDRGRPLRPFSPRLSMAPIPTIGVVPHLHSC